jgi:hypothetical protein
LTLGVTALTLVALTVSGYAYLRDDATGRGGATPAKGTTYTAVVQDRAFALRRPSTGSTQFDLDAPSALPSGDRSGRIELTYAMTGGAPDDHVLVFETPAGLSDSPAPEACRTAAGASALSGRTDAATVEKELVPGRILCTVTREGRLAMLRIERVERNGGGPDFLTRLTVWSMD